MPNFNIDLLMLGDAIEAQGRAPIRSTMETARRTINDGYEVIVHCVYNNAPPDILRRIRSLDDLELWRKDITPIPFKEFECPNCHETLKYMYRDDREWTRFKCYDPPGCNSIFRLDLHHPIRLMRFDEDGGPEIPFPANEI